MNILCLVGSRNPEGQTARAVAAIVEGAAGAVCETVFLPSKQVERCRQCDNEGWGICRHRSACVIDDDFADILAALCKADRVVVATPVYYADLSESLRAFLGRLRRVGEHGTGREGWQDKPVVGVAVAGGGGGGSAACCVMLEKILQSCGMQVVDLIPVRRQNLKAKRDQLRCVGSWFSGDE